MLTIQFQRFASTTQQKKKKIRQEMVPDSVTSPEWIQLVFMRGGSVSQKIVLRLGVTSFLRFIDTDRFLGSV